MDITKKCKATNTIKGNTQYQIYWKSFFSFNLNITKLYVLKISSKLGSGFSGQKRTVWEKNFKSYSPLMVPDTVYLNQKKKNYIKHGAKYACAYHQTFHTYS